MEVGDFVKAIDRDVQDYGIITDIVESGVAVNYVTVMLFNGEEKHLHPTRVRVLPKEGK